jgi:DNA-binding Lrp family transcriptional regulator
LEDAGILRGYRADVNLRKLGMGATVMVTITLDSQSEEAMAAFEEAVTGSPSIIRAHLMSGRNDYLLVVRAASIEDYEVIHRQEIARLPRVARIETAFALREVVNRTVPMRVLG